MPQRSTSSRAVNDEGVALVVTIGIGLAMLVLVAGALGAASSGLRAAATSQDSTGATDAAYSGVQDYLVRLNADPQYATRGNPNAPFTVLTNSKNLVTQDTANSAFATDTGGSSTWAAVPGSSGRATFRYELDNHAYSATGLLRLRSTGRVGNQTASLIADIRQKGFTDYVYFTDFEMQDPLITKKSPCDTYLWDPVTPRDATTCGSQQFFAVDNIEGPVHSNDSITVCGTVFTGPVETGRPGGGALPAQNCSSGPGRYQYAPNHPEQKATLGLPGSGLAMRDQVDLDKNSNPGCLYTGPTTVTLRSDGKMNVVSPWTKRTVIKGATGSSTAFDAQCGTIAALNSTAGATVPVPTGDVIYVQGVPTSSNDPNYSAPTPLPSGFTCYGPGGTGVDSPKSAGLSTATGSAGWWYGTDPAALRHPIRDEMPPSGWGTSDANGVPTWNTTNPAYGCTSGDVFIKGMLADYNGVASRLSVAADNYVYVTGDITYSNANSNLLGLVGTNGVLVYNPMKKTTTTTTSPYGYSSTSTTYTSLLGDTNRTIKASILSTAHTFQVPNFDVGDSRGTLNVYGSIGQRYRGAVIQGSGGSASGYAKNYVYDRRLANIAPPYFVTPSTSSFRVATYASTKAGFKPDGTPIP